MLSDKLTQNYIVSIKNQQIYQTLKISKQI